jgi:TatD DNase family protein
VGIGGVVTYSKGSLPDVVREVPLTGIILETDAPYLAPVPYRGKRNESSYIPVIAARIADLKGMTVKEIAEKTTANALDLFGN